MKTIHKILSLLMVFLLIINCSKDDENNAIIPVNETSISSEKQIISFVFNTANNETLNETITATINESNKIINTTVPYGTDITALIPTIQFSDKASVSPTGAQDFTDQVSYTVTAEDNTKATYSTTLTIAPNTEKEITSFVFKADDNDALNEDIIAVIDEESKTITAIVPASMRTSLSPSIQFSEGATIASTGLQDFMNSVTYTVTAQDGTSKDYDVIVSFSERDGLVAILNANPNNTLDWVLNDPDVNNWTGVNTNANGSIINLSLSNKGLEVIPPEIGNLTNLTALRLDNNDLAEIPIQIGQLTNLTTLFLHQNNLTEIPVQIKGLTKLTRLFLYNNDLAQIPPEIGSLINLTQLLVSSNELTEIPTQLGNLINLNVLNLLNNNLTQIPPQIGNLTKLTELQLNQNNLTQIPNEIGNLTNLIVLDLYNNQLTQIPFEIGGLVNLTDLRLQNNNLLTIPQAVCDLETNYETNIIVDDGTTCK